MSRGTEHGQPQTRQRILHAAWEILEEHGVGMRLVDVAERAGVSRQAVYLYFGDRAGLLVALVDHIDSTLDAEKLIAHVLGAPSGVEALARLTQVLAGFTKKIDPVARILETGRDQDEALAAAWDDRMKGRTHVSHAIAERIAQEGALAPNWTVETAADLIYALTSPRTWHMFIHELGWTPERYGAEVNKLLHRALIGD